MEQQESSLTSAGNSLAIKRPPIALDLSHRQEEWRPYAAFVRSSPPSFFPIRESILSQRYRIDRCTLFLMVLPFDRLITREEADYLEDWVLAGGGLFLLGTYAADTHHLSNPSYLARRFGFEFGNDLLLPGGRNASLDMDARDQVWAQSAELAVSVQPSSDHFILKGVNEAVFLSSCTVKILPGQGMPAEDAAYLVHTPDSTAVLEPEGYREPEGWIRVIRRWQLVRHSSEPVLAACYHGEGRVVVSGSRKICTLNYGDNKRLIDNILAWLNGT